MAKGICPLLVCLAALRVSAALQIHLEPSGSVLNVLLGQVVSVVCMVDSCNSSVTSFKWTYKGSYYSGQTFIKTVTNKSDSGTLECRVGNVRASTEISVLYPPEIHLEPRNDTLDVRVGEDLRVDCVVENAKPRVSTFQWSHNGRTSTGSTFLKRNITHSDGGKLTCTADNGHMMTPGRAVAHVNVQSALQIHLEPTGRVLNVLLGQVLSVVCVVDSFNSPATSFRWTHNGRSSPSYRQTFSKTAAAKSDAGTLECRAGNVRASTQISVLYPPEVYLEPGNDTLDVSIGEDLRVECLVDDANPGVHTFQWSHNGQTSNGSTFLKPNITRSDGGILTCTADNGHMMTPGRAVAYVNVQLQVSSAIWSDHTENQVAAIVTGTVGMVTIIILIVVIIHLRRSLHAAKLGRKRNERPKRTEQANRASRQQNYEPMETSSEGAEDTYCRFQMTPVRDNHPDNTYGNLGFAEEEHVQETSEPIYQNTSGSNQLAK